MPSGQPVDDRPSGCARRKMCVQERTGARTKISRQCYFTPHRPAALHHTAERYRLGVNQLLRRLIIDQPALAGIEQFDGRQQ
jgi:hypothetical protein